jgi:hypothetical protein
MYEDWTVKQKIKKSRYVFGWVMLNEHDGKYIQVQKQSILEAIKDFEKEDLDGDKFCFDCEGDLYIN